MKPRGSGHSNLGGKAGPRVARVMTDALNDQLRRSAFVRSRIHAEGLNEFFRGMSREKRQHTAPFWELFLGAETTPPELEKVLRFIAHGQGELSEVMGSMGLGNAAGTSILAAIQNYLAPLNQGLIAAAPYSVLGLGEIARASISDIPPGTIDYYAEAARNGFDATRFNIVRALAEQFPGVSEVLEAWRRELIDKGTVEYILKRQGITPKMIPVIMEMKREHLSPADAALATLRGIITEPQGEAIAAVAGVNAEDFKTLIGNTGEPPGLMQMLEGFRRGFINDAELQKGIRESRVRDEWIPLVEKLRFSPASAADAIDAVVQGHLSQAEAEEIAKWNGLRNEDFPWLVENAGSPMSNMQALELFNRGVVNEARVKEAIREGRTKNKYIDNIIHLRVKLPPVFQTVKMIATGGVSADRGAELLNHEGYEHDVVAGLVHAASSEQVTKQKGITVTVVEELYEEQAIDSDEALSHLHILGYTPANAKYILKVADLKRARKLLQAAAAPIRTDYVARKISESEASLLLDKLHMAGAQRDQYLAYWTVDRAANVKVLTPAQIIAANKLGLIPDDDAEKRLVQHGYTVEDARILMDSEKGRTTPAP